MQIARIPRTPQGRIVRRGQRITSPVRGVGSVPQNGYIWDGGFTGTPAGPNLLLNGGFDMRGDELVVNGDMSQGVDPWTTTSGMSLAVVGGEMHGTGQTGSPATARNQVENMVDGSLYTFTSTYRVEDGAAARPTFFGEALPDNETDVAVTNSAVITANQTSANFSVLSYGDVDTTLKFDNVSVKEIGQHWTYGDGWGLESDEQGGFRAMCDGSQNSGAELTQAVGGTNSGEVYEIKFTAAGVSGNTRLWLGGSAGEFVEEGPNMQVITRGGSNFLKLIADPSSQAAIDNMIVRLAAQRPEDWDGWVEEPGPGWWWSDTGVAVCDGPGTYDLSQTLKGEQLVPGDTVNVFYQVTKYVSGTIQAILGADVLDLNAGVGTYLQQIKLTGSPTDLIMRASNFGGGTIDNVQVWKP